MRRLFSLAVNAYAFFCLLSAPVFVGGLLWGLRLIAEQSLLAFGIICVATINMIIGFALMLDAAKAKNQG